MERLALLFTQSNFIFTSNFNKNFHQTPEEITINFYETSTLDLWQKSASRSSRMVSIFLASVSLVLVPCFGCCLFASLFDVRGLYWSERVRSLFCGVKSITIIGPGRKKAKQKSSKRHGARKWLQKKVFRSASAEGKRSARIPEVSGKVVIFRIVWLSVREVTVEVYFGSVRWK